MLLPRTSTTKPDVLELRWRSHFGALACNRCASYLCRRSTGSSRREREAARHLATAIIRGSAPTQRPRCHFALSIHKVALAWCRRHGPCIPRVESSALKLSRRGDGQYRWVKQVVARVLQWKQSYLHRVNNAKARQNPEHKEAPVIDRI